MQPFGGPVTGGAGARLPGMDDGPVLWGEGLIAEDAGLAGITRQLAVLAAFAAALLVLAVWRLGKALVG
jgi:hypothetical protein